MKIFLAQLNPIVGDLDGNAKNIFNVLSIAYKKSANLVELSNILAKSKKIQFLANDAILEKYKRVHCRKLKESVLT